MTSPQNPYYASPRPQTAAAHPGGTRRAPQMIAAAALGILGTICATLGQFFPYAAFTDKDHGNVDFVQQLTPWGYEYYTTRSELSPGLAQSIPPLYGVMLTLLALGLLGTTVLAFRASGAATGTGRVTAARATALGTASAALCLSLMLLLHVISFLSFEYNEPDDQSTETYSIAGGFWVIMGVGLLAVAAALLAALPTRRTQAPQWQQTQQYQQYQGQAPMQPYQQPYAQQQHPPQPYPQQQYQQQYPYPPA